MLLKIKLFKPNDSTHKTFGESLRAAAKAGVRILAYDCVITPDSIKIDKPVKIDLKEQLNLFRENENIENFEIEY